MGHRIYTVLSIYNSVRRLYICFDRCKPNGSNLTILRQRASIAMMLPRCQESARGVRHTGSTLADPEWRTVGRTPHEKTEKYRVSQQYWSGSPEYHKATKPLSVRLCNAI